MEYAFIDTNTDKIVRYDLKISEYDEFKKAHPYLERYHETAPSVLFDGTVVSGLDNKTDNTWKEVLSKIGEKHPASPLADNYVRKTSKQVKTKQILQKHLDRNKKR